MFNELLTAHLSSPKSPLKKVDIHRKTGKKGTYFQFSLQKENQVFHENYDFIEGQKKYEELLPLFKQAHLTYEKETLHLLANRRGEFKVVKREAVTSTVSTEHNKQKDFPFPEGEIHPFLQALGIQTKEGKIAYSQRDKFTQINQFVKITAPLLKEFKEPKIIDLGCGKGYLTLALFAFLDGKAEIVGVDRKSEVMAELNQIVQTLGWKKITFKAGSIESFVPSFTPDLVVALHACNTATDLAIEKGIEWGATGLLIAPCCHQELLPTLNKEEWYPLLKWGAIAEKFAALLTDAYRGEILTALGFKTDIIEFVDPEHTPKNLLIRAMKKGNPSQKLIDELLKKPLHFSLFKNLVCLSFIEESKSPSGSV